MTSPKLRVLALWAHPTAEEPRSPSRAEDSPTTSPVIRVVGASFNFGDHRPAGEASASHPPGSSPSSQTPSERFSHNPYSYEELTPTTEARTRSASQPTSALNIPTAGVVPGSSLRQRRAARSGSCSSCASSVGSAATPPAMQQPFALGAPDLSLESSLATPSALGAPLVAAVGLPEMGNLGSARTFLHPPSPTPSSSSAAGTLEGSQRPHSKLSAASSVASEHRSGNRSPVGQPVAQSWSDLPMGQLSDSVASALPASGDFAASSGSTIFEQQQRSLSSSLSQNTLGTSSSLSPTSEMKQLREVQKLLQSTLAVLQAQTDEQRQVLSQPQPQVDCAPGIPQPPVEQDPSQIICRDFLKGTCSSKRWKCKFLHTPLHPSLSPEAEVPLPITEPVATRGTSPLLPAQPVCASCPTCEENRRRGLVAEGQPPFMAPVTSPVMTSVMPQPWFHLAGIPTTPSVPPLPTTPPVCGPCLGYTGAMPWEYLTPEGLLVHGMQPCSHCVGPYPAALPH
eukprot:RCo011992